MGDSNSNSHDCPALPMDEARLQFGAWLRAARERAGLSIEAIAQETKISKSYISSLESGAMDALPGKVFGRGFVKNITRLLKSDGTEGLRLYDACWGSPLQDAKPGNDPASETEPHKTKSVMARIAEPVDVSSVVSQRLMKPDFAPAGESLRLPAGKIAGYMETLLRLPAGLMRSLAMPHVRLWILASVALALVLLVFGRWAAVNLHRSKLSLSSVSTQKQSEVTRQNHPQVHPQMLADRSANKPGDMQTQEASAIADAANTVQAVQAPVPASTVTDIKITTAQATINAESKLPTASETAQKSLDSAEDNPLYAPSTAGAAFEQVLELNVSEDVEVRMILDGKKVDKTWFEAKSHRYTFNDRAEIYILDASKLDMIYNGKSLGALGNPGRKRRIFLQAKASVDDFPK